MLVVISGTHASGKSTLISDFVARHPQFEVLPDPFELLDDADVEPGTDSFFAQLQVAAARLTEPAPGPRIAERGPLDFLAYLDALVSLRRPTRSPDLFARGLEITADAMADVDLIVLLPLAEADDIEVPDDEDPELRNAMNDSLLELADGPDLVGDATVIEITGAPSSRLSQLERAIAGLLHP
jgi:hypothetical protein